MILSNPRNQVRSGQERIMFNRLDMTVGLKTHDEIIEGLKGNVSQKEFYTAPEINNVYKLKCHKREGQM